MQFKNILDARVACHGVMVDGRLEFLKMRERIERAG